MLQNALDQWDCRIFKSTVRLEQNNEKTWFFTCWCKFMEIKSWLKNIGVGMAKNEFGYSCHRTLKLAEPQKGIRGINWFLVCVFSFLFCWKWEFSLLDSHIFCTSSCCHGQNYQNLLQLLWWRIVTRPFAFGYQLYFYTLQPMSCGFLKIIFELEAFSHSFKINFILVRQPRYLEKTIVSSAKFTILIL